MSFTRRPTILASPLSPKLELHFRVNCVVYATGMKPFSSQGLKTYIVCHDVDCQERFGFRAIGKTSSSSKDLGQVAFVLQASIDAVGLLCLPELRP